MSNSADPALLLQTWWPGNLREFHTKRLSGLTWASVDILIDTMQPGSFHVSHSQHSGDAMTYSDFLFFSFATLTTLGYGDITPITTQARSFAIVEAVYGVLYSAILIARLVGLYRPCYRGLGDRQR